MINEVFNRRSPLLFQPPATTASLNAATEPQRLLVCFGVVCDAENKTSAWRW
ncbi:hypothetical protein SOVF_021990 isoform B [Spinacia oleracea]|nr:hypothetical protein SOVF_021990 isoform B [Spinacia oleracea]